MVQRLFFLLIACYAMACVHTPLTQTKYREADLKTTSINTSGVIQRPVIVDLDVSQTKKTITLTKTEFSVSEIKELALFKLLNKNKADIIVEPMYEILVQEGQITVMLSGFPAKYKNFRMAKKEDLDLVKAGLADRKQITNMQNIDSIVLEEESKEPIAPVALFVGGGLVILLLILSLS